VVSSLHPGAGQSLLAVGIVLLAATVGQVALGWVGAVVRARITWRPARMVDAGMGAAVSVIAMLVITWFLASSLRPGPLPSLSRQISDSRVVTAVDRVMPEGARTLFSSFRQVLDDNELPTVFGGLSPERIRSVQPPAPGITSTAAVRRAALSVVEISGTADECSRRLDGSGFVIAPQHVLTNAHVVAGVDRPQVRVGGDGPRLAARVVVFDPRRDLAVLYVPDLSAAAVVAGFPGGGPFRLGAARIRDTLNARGADIYHRSQTTRGVFSLYADVEPGNSGGPLLSLKGDVYGVIFAKSLDDAQTGYALTVDEARPVVKAGRSATAAVDTDTCA
jgi:S1-C subfamily serine protease